MNEDFVSFELAKKLKEKGFNNPCFGWYYTSEVCGFDYKTLIVFNHSDYRGSNYKDMLVSHNDDKHIDAPTIHQVLKWLREENEIHITIDVDVNDNFSFYSTVHRKCEECWELLHYCDGQYNSYEQAALAGIEWVLDRFI